MGTKEGGFDADRAVCHDCTGNPQHPQFSLCIEAIAGFDLNRGHAFSDQHINTAQGILKQLVFCGVAGGCHGRNNATTSARNLFVARPIQAHFEFYRAITTMHDVRVAIDQTWG